jgi:phage baseplate assembly protein W
VDSLHTVLRTIRGERKKRPDHLTVFREFLDQLDRVGRAPLPRSVRNKTARRKAKRPKK